MGSVLLRFKKVTFGYHSQAEPLFKEVSFDLSPGWTGLVGVNGCGKSTLLKLATKELDPDEGMIEHSDDCIYCEQRTDRPPSGLKRFISGESKEDRRLKGHFNIGDDWEKRWDTLSHGERKIAQIALALGKEPQILAIDEPTNHLDNGMVEKVVKKLEEFKGIGIIVSHKRALLDQLCHRCLFIEKREHFLIEGGVSKGLRHIASLRASVKKEYDLKKKAYKKLSKEMVARSRLAESSRSRTSKKRIKKKDHDAKEKVNLSKLTGKDGVGGKLKRQLTGRLERAEKEYQNIYVKKDPIEGIFIKGETLKRHVIVSVPAATVSIGEDRTVTHPDLVIAPRDRISITGPNGTGKSTLLKKVVSLIDLPPDRIAYIPQEITAHESQVIREKVLRLSKEKRSFLMMIIARMGSYPCRLLDTNLPSPGEMRKLMLALGIVHSPYIIIMDEPTNHMDLKSVLLMEKALEQCPCSLLLVSHDHDFLDHLTSTRWHFKVRSEMKKRCEVTCDFIA